MIELLLPTETFNLLSQFRFVAVIYSVVFKNAKHAFSVDRGNCRRYLESILRTLLEKWLVNEHTTEHSDKTQT